VKKGLIRKGLVLSVIVLFISVGVQPVFAGESITSTLDKDEDCIECQVTDGYSLLKDRLLLYKVKVVTNIISSSSLGDIPEVKKDCQEILDIINYDGFWDIFCEKLWDLFISLAKWRDETLIKDSFVYLMFTSILLAYASVMSALCHEIPI
jgi:hypothetical protein